jgi:predicted alpha/beta superfamily hydrolase
LYTSVTIPGFYNNRRIWVYLPNDYAISGKRYPVLYMQDGQNLFDIKTSFSGEWGIDEYLDTIDYAGIVIGIDNGGEKRFNEYNPNDDPRYGKGLGRVYLKKIVTILKPYADREFRTMPGRETTSIAGSSLGGLIAFYAGLYYPGIFGSVGVISPSFSIVNNIEKQILKRRSKFYQEQRWYFYGGGMESENLVESIKYIGELMTSKLKSKVTFAVREKGIHSEIAWRKMFPAFYDWLMKSPGLKQ